MLDRRSMHVPGFPQPVTVTVRDSAPVSGLLQTPADARALLVLAHGAGAGMTHPLMTAIANALGAHGIATLRYQFPYMERGSKRPDPPRVAQATVRAAVDEVGRLAPGLPLFAGGKSFGGRMTSQAQATSPLLGVRGLVFLGFPLHPAGKPGDQRAAHLFDVHVPMLFLQGTRDSLAEPGLMQSLVARLGPRAILRLFDDADHSFHVPARSGGNDEQVRRALGDAIEKWIARILGRE